MGKLSDLSAAGTAVWLDFVDRKFLEEGGLEKLVEADGLTGVTSNPSIFEKAMGHGDAYDGTLAAFDRENPARRRSTATSISRSRTSRRRRKR